MELEIKMKNNSKSCVFGIVSELRWDKNIKQIIGQKNWKLKIIKKISSMQQEEPELI